jgi:hypothetical protein
MEELLPLIIGILWLAYTWYSKGQKKKQGKENPQVRKKQEPSILEQILTGQTVSFSEPEPVYEEIIEEEDELFTDLPVKEEKSSRPFLNAELSNYIQEGQSISEEVYGSSFDQEFEEEELFSNPLANMEDFDLRKAVIYSEILNTPYIDYK